MPKMFFLKLVSIAILSVSNVNCADLQKKPAEQATNQTKNQTASQTTSQTTKQQMDQLSAEITALIGEATCTTNQQCASIEMGAKPCGGPWSYRAYSTQYTNKQKLEAVALNYKRLNKRYNKESGLMSDCMMEMPPTVACVNNKCQISQP